MRSMTIHQRVKNVLKRCGPHKSCDVSQRAAGVGWVWQRQGTVELSTTDGTTWFAISPDVLEHL